MLTCGDTTLPQNQRSSSRCRPVCAPTAASGHPPEDFADEETMVE